MRLTIKRKSYQPTVSRCPQSFVDEALRWCGGLDNLFFRLMIVALKVEGVHTQSLHIPIRDVDNGCGAIFFRPPSKCLLGNTHAIWKRRRIRMGLIKTEAACEHSSMEVFTVRHFFHPSPFRGGNCALGKVLAEIVCAKYMGHSGCDGDFADLMICDHCTGYTVRLEQHNSEILDAHDKMVW